MIDPFDFGAHWSWAHPWALALVLLPLLLRLFLHWRRLRQPAYAEPALMPWASLPGDRRLRLRALLADLLIWALLGAALAGPRQVATPGTGARPRTEHRIDLLVLLDVGPAMQRRDAAGLRGLDRARLALRDLLPRLHGERLGLAVYGAGTGELLPPSSDRALFRHFLGLAGARLAPRTIPGEQPPPLALGAVIRELAQRLRREAGQRPAALLLIAGDDLAAGELRPPANLPLAVLAVDASTARRALLRRLAAQAGGAYARLRAGQSPWPRLYDGDLAELPGAAPAPGSVTRWHQGDAWFLLPALLLLLWRWRPNLPGRGTAIGLLLAALLAMPPPGHAATPQARAWQAWHAGNYAAAEAAYAALSGWAGRFGQGAALYRRGDYAGAAAQWRRALLLARTPRQRAWSLYDLGNASLHLPQGTHAALDAYRAAHALLPDDERIRRNLAIAEARWRLLHPPKYLQEIGARGAAYGFPNPQKAAPPSKAGKKPPAAGRNPASRDQGLTAGGRLAGAVGRSGGEQGLALSRAEREAARRKLDLLHDDVLGLWRRTLRVDRRAIAAASRAAASRADGKAAQ